MMMDKDDYDSPWKEILEYYFQDFMTFFFPQAAQAVDWTKGYQFLDKELEQVVRDAALGRRYADKLVQLWLKDAETAWVMVHVEIQGQTDSEFAKRMYVYNYRIFDRYDRAVASMAVLADNHPGWKPDNFTQTLFGCTTGIRFPVVKLLDYAPRCEALENHPNPFSVAVMAHLKTSETQKDTAQRKAWKLRLIKTLYERGTPRQDILNLFRFIDWMMKLPEELEKVFWEEMQQYEEDKHMPYVTSVEKIGYQRGVASGRQEGRLEGKLEGKLEGRLEGLREGIELALQIKFGGSSHRLVPRLHAIVDFARLNMIKEALKTATDIKKIESLLNEQ